MSQRENQNDDRRPLTEREITLLERLLSDPYRYPQEFKTWLISYLEITDMNLPISVISGLNERLGQLSFPQTRVIGAQAAGTADANGLAFIPYFPELRPGEFVAAVLVTNNQTGSRHIIFSATVFDASGFQLLMWNTTTQAVAAGSTFRVSWLLLIQTA